MPLQERPFLADYAALVPGDAGGTKGGEKIDGHGFISRPRPHSSSVMPTGR
jgi:hypothetical protein